MVPNITPHRHHQTLHLLFLLLSILVVVDGLRRPIPHRLKLIWKLFCFDLVEEIAELGLHTICFSLRIQSNGMGTQARALVSINTTS